MSPSDDLLAAAYVGDANHVDGEPIEDPVDKTDTLQNVPVLPRRRPGSQAQTYRPLREGRRREVHLLREFTPLRFVDVKPDVVG